MRIPDPGPLGETRFEASDRAMVAASFVNNPFGGSVETVFTLATQRLPDPLRVFLPARADVRRVRFDPGMIHSKT
ncbi:MAG TPA: hypothetical protein VFO39_06645 [Candidatus Sulfotelmatobacter sp.]|nr:hypothetical protein [Candidatus Sulfotelmatobacter sp.]